MKNLLFSFVLFVLASLCAFGVTSQGIYVNDLEGEEPYTLVLAGNGFGIMGDDEKHQKTFRWHEEKVDGVHISNRQSLHDDVRAIIEDQIKRDFDAVNMRGFLLDALSQMEGTLRNKFAEYFQSLDANVRYEKVQELIKKIRSKQESALSRVEKFRDSDNVDGMLGCTALVNLDVVRDALKDMADKGENVLGQKSEFCLLQQDRNRWAHDSISLDASGQRVVLANDKSHPSGYSREDFEKMRVLLGKVGAEVDACVKGLIFDAKK